MNGHKFTEGTERKLTLEMGEVDLHLPKSSQWPSPRPHQDKAPVMATVTKVYIYFYLNSSTNLPRNT
jgi:hypothetical protein